MAFFYNCHRALERQVVLRFGCGRFLWREWVGFDSRLRSGLRNNWTLCVGINLTNIKSPDISIPATVVFARINVEGDIYQLPHLYVKAGNTISSENAEMQLARICIYSLNNIFLNFPRATGGFSLAFFQYGYNLSL